MAEDASRMPPGNRDFEESGLYTATGPLAQNKLEPLKAQPDWGTTHNNNNNNNNNINNYSTGVPHMSIFIILCILCESLGRTQNWNHNPT